MSNKNKKANNAQKKPGLVAKKIKEAVPLALCIGKMDIIYRLEFTQQDLLKPAKQQKENDKYFHIEDLNSIKDLEFIKSKKSIYDKIQFIPNNDTLEQLHIANKISKKKMHVDFIPYGRPFFEGEEEFFNDIFIYVNDKNHIDVNSRPLSSEGPYSFTFELIYKDRKNSISLSCEGEEKKEEKKKQKDDYDDEDEDYEENAAMKNGKIPKFTRKDSVLCNMVPRYNRYCSFYLNFYDIKDIPGDFEKRDLIEFVFFLKKKGIKIFMNFYQPEKEEDEKKEEEKNKNKDNQIADETYDTSGKANEKDKNKENEEEEEGETKEEREMKDLNNLYYLTDLYFFENKQAIKEFDKHYQFFRDDKKVKNSINKQKLLDYFIKGVASGTKNEVDGNKVGFFLDDFMKYFVVRAAKKNAKKFSFDCQLYPKINHSNMSLIDDYKRIIKKNINHYISLFITFILQGVTSSGSTSNEVIIGAYLNALEIIKRKVECEKNNIILSEKDLMKFKLSDKNLEERIKELLLETKEGNFILDCTNKEKSELKEYVPLYDYHLVYYFRSENTQKQLYQKGFINEKGFIMYDHDYRKRMRPDLENKYLNHEETKKKVELNIKNIDVGVRIKDKEIDSSKFDKNLVTKKKLPNFMLDKKNKKKTKDIVYYEKEEPQEPSGSSSDPYEDENKDSSSSARVKSVQIQTSEQE